MPTAGGKISRIIPTMFVYISSHINMPEPIQENHQTAQQIVHNDTNGNLKMVTGNSNKIPRTCKGLIKRGKPDKETLNNMCYITNLYLSKPTLVVGHRTPYTRFCRQKSQKNLLSTRHINIIKSNQKVLQFYNMKEHITNHIKLYYSKIPLSVGYILFDHPINGK